ncbi:CapA family protein [Paenibacillus allorhizosphaerae]|uniref:Capsule synthesis protein CapA domain-containing protein n=1 Tax=Paenibacillus allorhizosphaerae TaxID=2849866 RepID=A0ABM8VMY8_9BACL|nr:CapA family protein [Paenibacillus allorhizosphaerae]CAG7650618.1 hypothetical protein PAECIP111802_04765 [Paenibacillus allorhizosphaerae]
MLTVLTIGAFAYLVHWLDQPSDSGPGQVAAESPGITGKPNDSGGSNSAAGTAPNEKPPPDSSGGTVQPVQEERVNLTFIGDVMFADKVNDLIREKGKEYPFKYVNSYLEKADITVANLETPITLRGSAQTKEYVYRSSPEMLPVMKKAGIDLVNLANNHSMDYGQDGLVDTLDYLDQYGILRVGAGRNTEEAYRSVIMNHQGIKIAFLGFSRVIPETSWYAGKSKPGLAETYSTKLPLEAIAKAREQADLVVVIAHWGEERNDLQVKHQTDLAHLYIDNGADLVIASHPHVLQGFEQYKGKWIAYSLGNFIFTTNNIPMTWESMILEASCTKARTCELSMVPIITKWAQPIQMPEEDGLKLFERLTGISVNAKIDKEGKITPGPVRTPKSSIVKPQDSVKKPETQKPAETGKNTDSAKTPAATQPSGTGNGNGAKQGETKPGTAKTGETKPGDVKQSDPKQNGAKTPDPKSSDPKKSDPKKSETKPGDVKQGGDPKQSDAKKSGTSQPGSKTTETDIPAGAKKPSESSP